MKRFLSLSADNQFSFTCPLFNATTKMASCVALRELHWRGRQPEKRKGCQAAMACGKCPAAAMVTMISMGHWDNDHHGSVEAKHGKLHARVLERIARPMMRDSVMDQYVVPSTERMLMLDASKRIVEQLKTAPGDTVGPKGSIISGQLSEPKADTPVRKKAKTPTPANDAAHEAARTGDLSAAINA